MSEWNEIIIFFLIKKKIKIWSNIDETRQMDNDLNKFEFG